MPACLLPGCTQSDTVSSARTPNPSIPTPLPHSPLLFPSRLLPATAWNACRRTRRWLSRSLRHGRSSSSNSSSNTTCAGIKHLGLADRRQEGGGKAAQQPSMTRAGAGPAALSAVHPAAHLYCCVCFWHPLGNLIYCTVDSGSSSYFTRGDVLQEKRIVAMCCTVTEEEWALVRR